VCQYDLDTAILLGAPVAGLSRQRPADCAVRVDQPGPARVDQERLAVMAEGDLLAEVRALDGGVPDDAGTLPPADQEAHRLEARVLLEVLRQSAGLGRSGLGRLHGILHRAPRVHSK